MANVTSEDVQALTSVLLKLVDEVSDSAHHATDALSDIESRMEDVKDELKALNATLERAAYGGVGYPGALEKQSMELAHIGAALDKLVAIAEEPEEYEDDEDEAEGGTTL